MMLHTKYTDTSPYGFRQDVKHVTPGLGHFLPQGHNLNKLGRGSIDDATYQISMLYVL